MAFLLFPKSWKGEQYFPWEAEPVGVFLDTELLGTLHHLLERMCPILQDQVPVHVPLRLTVVHHNDYVLVHVHDRVIRIIWQEANNVMGAELFLYQTYRGKGIAIMMSVDLMRWMAREETTAMLLLYPATWTNLDVRWEEDPVGEDLNENMNRCILLPLIPIASECCRYE